VPTSSFEPTQPQFDVVVKREVDQACRPWFFGGSCVRADPDNKATKSERDGTITGIFFVCLAISCVLGLILVITLDEEMNPFICISACTCIALMLLMLCIGIAALQEVSAVVSIMLSNVRLN
jgi:hypothetical protein